MDRIRLHILVSLLLLQVTLLGQNSVQSYSVEFQEQNITLPSALAGGLNAAGFSEGDLNNDGIQDLLVYDRSGQNFITYINQGTPGVVDYQLNLDYLRHFPEQKEGFFVLRDYNSDNIPDAFYYGRQGFSFGIGVKQGYYINDTLAFRDIITVLTYGTGGDAIYEAAINLPGIADIDMDGDMDILATGSGFSGVANNFIYYRNICVERGLNIDTPVYEIAHYCFGLFTEDGFNNTVALSPSVDSCALNAYWSQNYRHYGTTLSLVDHNADGAMDLAIGDNGVNTLNMLTSQLVNIDTTNEDTLLMISQDATYPSYDSSIGVNNFPAAFFIDVNNDGYKDMIVGVHNDYTEFTTNDSVAWYYQNTSTSGSMDLQYQQSDFLVEDMLDMGAYSQPCFFDYNKDGLKDLLVGNYAYTNTDNSKTYAFHLFENIGTATQAKYNLIQKDYITLSTLQKTRLHPTVGDIDRDGDMDLLLGEENGTFIFVENIATTGASLPVWNSPELNYQTLYIPGYTTPQLIDIDGDSLLDIVTGASDASLLMFKNVGTASVPVFTMNDTIQKLGGIDLFVDRDYYLYPRFVRDSSNRMHLFVGTQKGKLYHYDSIGMNPRQLYRRDTNFVLPYFIGRYLVPAVADIDSNADNFELIVGNIRGGLTALQYEINYPQGPITVGTKIEKEVVVTIYPNPVRDMVHIELLQANRSSIDYTVYNTLGQVMLKGNSLSVGREHRISTEALTSGVYTLELWVGNHQKTFKFIKQ